MPTIKTKEINLHYEERGNGEPLILIMGLGAPGSLWEDHVAVYERYFRCFLIDNRGAGTSDQPIGPYTTKIMAEDVAGLMKALNLTKTHVAGISMGSAIAQELALAYPHLIQSLILISSWSRCDQFTKAIFEHFKKMRAIATPADFVQLLQLWISTPNYYEDHFQKMVQDQVQAVDGYMSLHSFIAQCDACSGHDTFSRLDQITAPTLLTVGDADIFTPLRLTAEMHEKMPDSEMFIVNGCGHTHHWEDLEQFNAKTLHFLCTHSFT